MCGIRRGSSGEPDYVDESIIALALYMVTIH